MGEVLLRILKDLSTEYKIIGGLGFYVLSKLGALFGKFHWNTFKLKRTQVQLLEIKEKQLRELKNKELWLLRERKAKLLKELGMSKGKK